MQIDFRIRSVGTAGQLREFAENSLAQRLGQLSESVTHAAIRVDDVNGPRGGEDKRCRVVLHLRQRGLVVVEECADDWYQAVVESVGRAVRSARKAIGKRRDRRREELPLPEAA